MFHAPWYCGLVSACLLLSTATVAFAQSRDFQTQRLILDDNAGDGSMNTLTISPGNLTTNQTLQIPVPNGPGGSFLISNPTGPSNQTMSGTLSIDALRLNSASTSYFVEIMSPPGMGASLFYTLPSLGPTTDGQVLAATSAGVMSWVPASGLVHFTESYNAALDVAGISAVGTASDIGVILAPKGNGALQADAGGDPRGNHATDWSRSRIVSSQVASGESSTIGGGANSTASGPNSTVGGGHQNVASGYASTIAGGYTNTASSFYATIGGGLSNSATFGATVSGGTSNDAGSTYAVVVGGSANRALALRSSILGGEGMTLANSATGSLGVLSSTVSSTYDVMVIGEPNVVVFGNHDLLLANNDGTPSMLRFYEAQSSTGPFPAAGVNYSAIRAGVQSSDIIYTLPTAAPNADGQVMTATTTGIMGWSGDLRVDAPAGLVRTGSAFGTVLGDPDTDDDGLLDATGDATAVPFGTLRFDASADKVQAFVSDSDGLDTDGWINLH